MHVRPDPSRPDEVHVEAAAGVSSETLVEAVQKAGYMATVLG
jgi:hypothetical protein